MYNCHSKTKYRVVPEFRKYKMPKRHHLPEEHSSFSCSAALVVSGRGGRDKLANVGRAFQNAFF